MDVTLYAFLFPNPLPPTIGTTAVWTDVANGGTSPVTVTPATTGNVFYRVQQTP